LKTSALMTAAVIGTPVQHSLSPAIFRKIAAMENCGLEYSKEDVTTAQLDQFLNQLRSDENRVGVNVTIPHKEAVMPHLDQISNEAKAIGAVNVVQHEGKSLLGFNTDVIGIESTFKKLTVELKGRSAFLWGAGGSAKAVCYALGRAGAREVCIYNPRSSRGAEIAKQFQTLFPATEFKEVNHFSGLNHSFALVVNSTPVGMHSSQGKSKEAAQEDELFFSGLEQLNFEPGAVAFDLIYTPRSTPFLRRAQRLKLRPENGLGMLIDQALASWKIWVGPLKNEKILHEDLAKYLQGILNLRENQKPIFLTGFMAVGKSSVAVNLAKLIGRTAVDTDQVVVERAGKSIADIFSIDGEPAFRKLEAETIAELSHQKNKVVSLGGGALMHGKNLEVIQASGALVYLSASESVLETRLMKEGVNRPLLSGLNSAERMDKIKELLDLRKPIYEAADITINTDHQSLDSVVEAVLTEVGNLA
jgi:shikimate dehydrogenase